MTNRNVVRAAFVIAVALSFSIGSLRYSIGTFAHAGPGLFPLVISTIVLLLGVISLIQSRYEDPVQMTFALRGFAIILTSFCGFAAVSYFIGMAAGIVFMVFCASLAGSSFSWSRSLKIAAALLVVALLMNKVLNLDLPLY